MATEAPVNGALLVETQQQDVEKGNSGRISQASTEKRAASPKESENTIVAPGQPEYDPNDPTLPLNWSTSKKYFNTIVPAMLTFVV